MMTKLLAGVATLAVVALLGGTWIAIQSAQSEDRFAECRAGAIGHEPMTGEAQCERQRSLLTL